MAKKRVGGKIDFAPKLDRPKNMPGDIMKPGVSKMFGGKGRLKPHEGGKMHKEGGDFGADQHGLHGAGTKMPSMSMKAKGKKRG